MAKLLQSAIRDNFFENYNLLYFKFMQLFIIFFLSIQWIFFRFIELPYYWEALLAGLGIFGAAFLLSWAGEVAEVDIPRNLSLAILAIFAVLPEYAVDIYFAWMGGKDVNYAHYASANMTGGNRLLIGIGWAVVILFTFLKTKQKKIFLKKEQSKSILILMIATIYSFLLPLKRGISIFDAIVLLGIFFCYIKLIIREQPEYPELIGIPLKISLLPKIKRRITVILFFILGVITIYLASEPFAEGLLKIGERCHIEKFILVQWVAPLASESPEMVIAIILTLKLKPQAGLGFLISSKINQWSLLVGMLPIIFSISGKTINPLPLDFRQSEEIFLTAAQSLFATLIISNLQFSIYEGLFLFLLFSLQLVMPGEFSRIIFSIIYLIFSIFIYVRGNLGKEIKSCIYSIINR